MNPATHTSPSVAAVMASFAKLREATDALNVHSHDLWGLIMRNGFPVDLIRSRTVLLIRAGMKTLRPSEWDATDLQEVREFKVLLERWWKARAKVLKALDDMPESQHDEITRSGVAERIQQCLRQLRHEINCPTSEWCRDDFSLWLVEWALGQSRDNSQGLIWSSRRSDGLKSIALELSAAAKCLGVKTTIHGLTRNHFQQAAKEVRKRGKCLATEQMVSHVQTAAQLSKSASLLCLQVLRHFGVYAPIGGRSPRAQQLTRVQEVIAGLKLDLKFLT